MSIKVIVKDFQSIRHAEIVIDGLTAITGPNNTGKSALLRAIRGVFQNTRGTNFVRHGAAKCSVELIFDDGRSVRWEKGPKIKPTYHLDGGKDNGGKTLYPGQGVPDEVKALGVHAITAGGREIWPQVALQLSGQVFLLDEPGSVLAEAVANVDRVGRLNRALKASEKDRRAAASTLKVRLADKLKIETEMARYEGLDEVAKEVVEIEALAHQAGRVVKALEGLTVMRDRLEKALETVGALEGVEGIEIPEAKEARDTLEELDDHQALQYRLQGAQGRVTKYEGVETIEVGFDTSPVEKILLGLGKLKALESRMGDSQTKVEGFEKMEAKHWADLEAAEQEVSDILGDLGECPVCGVMTGEEEHDHASVA